MAERAKCPLCDVEFYSKKEEFHHLRRWGCPTANKVLKELAAPLCACGCGEKVVTSKRNPKSFNKFKHGHNKAKKRN